MTTELSRLLEEMSPQERMEVVGFAESLIAGRRSEQPRLLTDDITSWELSEELLPTDFVLETHNPSFPKTGSKRRSESWKWR